MLAIVQVLSSLMLPSGYHTEERIIQSISVIPESSIG